MFGYQKEKKRQELIAFVVSNRSENSISILAYTFITLAKQAFCKHQYIGLECIKCGKQKGLKEFYGRQQRTVFKSISGNIKDSWR